MKFSVACILFIYAIVASYSNAFAPSIHSTNNRTAFFAPKAQYGPDETDDTIPNPVKVPTSEQKEQFQNLFNEVLNCAVREHLPGIVTKHIDLLVSLNGGGGLKLFNEQLAKAQETGDQELIERAHATVEYIVFFVETFVSQAKVVDDNNKALLGKIFKCIKDAEEDSSSLEKQEKLDALIKVESENFTPGFLRHLEAVCTRISNAKKMTSETAKLLEVMRVIQARIIEEVGQHLGEGAQVLGQLLGYECSTERLAVLDAGLKVRGVEFATELKAMTDEALAGFEKVGGVEPGLIEIVKEVDERIDHFINENK